MIFSDGARGRRRGMAAGALAAGVTAQWVYSSSAVALAQELEQAAASGSGPDVWSIGSSFSPFVLVVLRLEHGGLAEMAAFEQPSMFTAFGLPDSLLP